MKHLASNHGHRALELLMGMQDPHILAALVPFGYTPQVMAEGFELLRKAMHLRISKKPGAVPEPVLAQQLDEFEGTWYPIARNTLARAFPAIAEQFFRNIGQQSRSRVALSVMAFLGRLADLAQADGPFGREGPAARALLVQRGLTVEVEAQANALVQSLADARAASEEPLSPEQQVVVEKDLRLWYLEWSAIARVAIKDKRQRRRLGFLKAKATIEEEDVAAAPPASGSTGPGLATPQLPPTAAPAVGSTLPLASGVLVAADVNQIRSVPHPVSK